LKPTKEEGEMQKSCAGVAENSFLDSSSRLFLQNWWVATVLPRALRAIFGH